MNDSYKLTMVSYDTDTGAQFIKADLHTHTPGSYDYPKVEAEEDGKKEEELDVDISAEDIIEEYEDQGIELVAVTDHNTNEFFEDMAEAAEDSQVTVLPGVEITTGQSGEHQIHMTAIFSPEDADEIDYLLEEIGVRGDPQSVIADKTIPGICDDVKDRGGIPILAHIDETAGAHYELSDRKNPTRKGVFDPSKVGALEIVNSETSEEFPDFTHIMSSDAHNLDEVGRGYTFFKMSEPSFEGLQTALSDPESRVRLAHDQKSHTSVDGLQVENGFLEKRHLGFNDNLNCLIGGKGTGKSTIIEHIRYALEDEPGSKSVKEDFESLIEETLAPDGAVELTISANNGEQYKVSRNFDEPAEIIQLPKDPDEEPSNISFPMEQFRSEFFDVEIFSQNQLLAIARNVDDQLKLLDSYFSVERAKEQRDSIKQEIRELTRDIETQKEELEDLQSRNHRRESIEQQVEVMREKGVDEYYEDGDEWERERAQISRIQTDVENVESEVEELDLADRLQEIEVEEGPNEELLREANDILVGLIKDVELHQEALLDDVKGAVESINEKKEEWTERNSVREEEHEKLADEIEDDIGIDVEKYFSLQEELDTLRGVEEDLEKAEEELEELLEEKEEYFDALDDARDRLTEKRDRGVEELNDELEDVRIKLHHKDNRSDYIDWVNKTLKGSHMRTDNKTKIANNVLPKDLADLVRAENVDGLAAHANIPESTAELFIEYDDLRSQLSDLELIEVHDRPVIELNDKGWKRLSEMSDGQQCTALLSIAMVERDVPLIIDQPEDQLDNEFIVSEVVRLIRSIKHGRQVIAATHDANIPVLGDAELIVVMESNGEWGFYPKCGSIDKEEIARATQEKLEGGADAFRRRDEKYRRTF